MNYMYILKFTDYTIVLKIITYFYVKYELPHIFQDVLMRDRDGTKSLLRAFDGMGMGIFPPHGDGDEEPSFDGEFSVIVSTYRNIKATTRLKGDCNYRAITVVDTKKCPKELGFMTLRASTNDPS